MTYQQALKELDEPQGDEPYGVKMMASKTTGQHIVKSKFGLCYCTCDWPAPFFPTEKDLAATDYRIVTSTSE